LTQRPSDRAAALFGALSLFLSAIDYLLPKPLPFMRIGLANLPLLLALGIPAGFGAAGKTKADFPDRADLADRADLSERSGRPFFSLNSYCLLVLIKVLGQAFITGTFLSYVFLFSLAGSAVSAAIMYGLRRIFGAHISLAGISVAGAFASNGAQLVLARFFLFGESALYLAPPFLAAGIISGAVLGIFADSFIAGSRFFQAYGRAGLTETYPLDRPADQSRKAQVRSRPAARFLPLLLFCAGLAAAVGFLVTTPIAVKAGLVFLFWLFTVFAGKKTRLLTAAAVMTGIIVCNLFPPFGRILVTAGPFSIAAGSLESGVRKALNLEGLVMLSKLVVPAQLRLPGTFGRLMTETFRILERLNGYRGLFGGTKKTPNQGTYTANKNAADTNNADNPARKKRFMERLDLLLLELSEP
jgi:heptaprenyl diphosphate synthase